jgi:2'-5' RNA ligase
MRHRIFIAINLPEDVKKELISFQEKCPDLPCRWTKKDNLHITLAFIGSVNDEEIPGICKAAKEAAGRHDSFSINFKKICYGPPGKVPPRMVWIEGEKSKELADLRDDLENSLLQSSGQKYQEIKSQPFSPHITLGRIKEWEFRKIEPEERPEVETDINLDFEVNSIEVMESELKRVGPEYIVLESVPLSNLH